MVGPDALKWCWLLVGFGLLLLVDGWLNWGIFNLMRDPVTKRTQPYGPFGRITRLVLGGGLAMVGAYGLAYLAFTRVHP